MSKKKKNKLILAISSVFFFMSVAVMTLNLSTTEVSAQTSCEEREYSEVCCGSNCEYNGIQANYCIQGEDDQYSCCYNNCSPDID